MPQANTNRITPSLPRALPPAARKKVETAIEAHLGAVDALTAFLDEADGDENLEPSLGAVEPRNWSDDRQRYQHAGDDREDQCEDEGHDSDRELEFEEPNRVPSFASEGVEAP
jgi:hypothetical protein